MKQKLVLCMTGICSIAWSGATAADLQLKQPAAAGFEWTGFFFGGHLGAATGHTGWGAAERVNGIPTLSGGFDLFVPHDPFKGTGSYHSGIQVGYNYLLSSRFLVGFEVDASAPNRIFGSQAVVSPLSGQADYSATVLGLGTARARFGHELGRALIYGTGGIAWEYERRERTQLSPNPLTGNQGVGIVESTLLWRWGWVAGLGLEVPIAPNWTVRGEYLAAIFDSKSKTFPTVPQSLKSDLSIQTLRLGVNYLIGSDIQRNETLAKGISALDAGDFNVHGQTTFTSQYAFPFRAPYGGQNSLDANAGRETFDLNVFLGYRPWQGAEIWLNPEIDQGFGLSRTFGVAGFPSAEAYKAGATYPYARLPRAFLRQTINFGGEAQKVDAGINQFAGTQTSDRLVITVGKFGVVDIFDRNKYAGDPRNDFLNWTAVSTGTFDYAADAWAFTYGAALEWYMGPWTVRGGIFDGPTVPNSTDLDPKFGQFQMVGEIERRYDLWGQPGKLAVTGYLTRARLGNFQDAVNLAAQVGGLPDLAQVRTYVSKLGFSANVEQQILPGIGFFARGGYTPGKLEAYAFTDVDMTLAGGLSLSGKLWGRPSDNFGIAAIRNAISWSHQAYLNAGGYTALIGDGMLPRPGTEKILEAYYTLPILSWMLTLDYQFIANPAYNRDRGPVSIIASRLHAQF